METKRLFDNAHEDNQFISDEDSNVLPPPVARSFSEKLRQAENELTSSKIEQHREATGSIAKDFAAFEGSGKRTENLEKLYQALRSIPPTSVVSEQAFSISGSFVTKKRCRMSDDTLNDLCFLQGYFCNKNKKHANI